MTENIVLIDTGVKSITTAAFHHMHAQKTDVIILQKEHSVKHEISKTEPIIIHCQPGTPPPMIIKEKPNYITGKKLPRLKGRK